MNEQKNEQVAASEAATEQEEKTIEQPDSSVRTEEKSDRENSEKVNLNQLEQINAQEREAAQEEELAREAEDFHGDTETLSEAEKPQELTQDEIRELSALDRASLVARLESLFDRQELEAAKNVVALLRLKYKEKTGEIKKAALDKFLEEGGNKIDFRFADALEERFQSVNQKIKDYHQKKRDDLEKLMADNLLKKQALIEELKQLIEEDKPLKQTYDAFNKLTEKWREIKPIARAESNNLWQSYHFLVEKFFDKVRINNELRELDFRKNLEEKLQLCEKAEKLILEESVSKASRELHQLHDRWKEIGPVMMEKKDEIWERFKAASDAIAERRKAYYDKLQAEREQNLLAKKALCEKAEDLLAQTRTSVKDWHESTDQVEELMKLWKSIGRAPQADNDAIWQRFRRALDTFFESKKSFFRKMRDEQSNNYNLKVDLCVQAENIAQQRYDYKAATEDLLKLQRQWKEIGPVPSRLSDKVWKRFRAACDAFFQKKSEYYESLRADENANLESKKALIEEARQLAADNREAFLDAVKDLQRRWTEIGHVPMKEKDKIYAEFRAVIDEKFKTLGFRRESAAVRQFSNIQTPEDAAMMSGKNLSALRNKIVRMKEDIVLWENNMGFISKAKSSSVLRAEFERKIERARQDLALLEAKLKMAMDKPAKTAADAEPQASQEDRNVQDTPNAPQQTAENGGQPEEKGEGA